MKRVTSHAGRDISGLKIYRDDSVGQFKVRHHCEECKLDLGCFCYDEIEDAMRSCDETTWVCARHTLYHIWIDYELAEDIDRVCGTNLVSEVLKSVAERDDYESDAIKAILSSITEKQALSILIDGDLDCDDFDVSGSLCRA